MKEIFTDEIAREILEKPYPPNKLSRKLIKTIHKAGYDNQQNDSIIYSLQGSPGKGQLIIWCYGNEVRTMRLFDYWGGIIRTIRKYNYYKLLF